MSIEIGNNTSTGGSCFTAIMNEEMGSTGIYVLKDDQTDELIPDRPPIHAEPPKPQIKRPIVRMYEDEEEQHLFSFKSGIALTSSTSSEPANKTKRPRNVRKRPEELFTDEPKAKQLPIIKYSTIIHYQNDDEDLQQALRKQRQTNVSLLLKDHYEDISTQDMMEQTKFEPSGISFSETTKFLSSVVPEQQEPTHLLDVAYGERQEPNDLIDDQSPIESKTIEQEKSSTEKQTRIDDNLEIDHELLLPVNDEPAQEIFDVPLVRNGVGATLSYLRLLGSSLAIRMRRPSSHRRLRSQGDQQPAKASFEINLQYHDTDGNVLGPKQAYKELSHQFHGNAPGKRKKEKQLDRLGTQHKLQAAQSIDTPLGTAEALRETQRRSGTSHVLLSRGGKSARTNNRQNQSRTSSTLQPVQKPKIFGMK